MSRYTTTFLEEVRSNLEPKDKETAETDCTICVDARAFIEKLGLSSKVEWVQPMSETDLLELYYCSGAAPLVRAALGGVGFETMALGLRLITAINQEQTDVVFR